MITIKKYMREVEARKKEIDTLIKSGYLSITDEVIRLKQFGFKVHAPYFVERYGSYYYKKPITTGERVRLFLKPINESDLIAKMKTKKNYKK